MLIVLDKKERWVDHTPNKDQLNKFTAKELCTLCLRNNIGFKEVLINYLLTKNEIR